MFIQKESWVEAADTILTLIKNDPEKSTREITELYKEAIDYLDKAKKYSRALEISENSGQYKLMINLIIKYERYLNDFGNFFEKKLKKYCFEVEKTILSKCKLISFLKLIYIILYS